MIFLRLIDRVSPPRVVFAHCDIPCGIYDPTPARIAAAAVAKMVEKIMNPPDRDEKSQQSVMNYHNNMTRFVIVKEQEAEKCKRELLILWTDFFKPEHLKMFPKLHDTFWRATKLCSQNKQEVNEKAAKDLVNAVEEIAKMYTKAKASTKK